MSHYLKEKEGLEHLTECHKNVTIRMQELMIQIKRHNAEFELLSEKQKALGIKIEDVYRQKNLKRMEAEGAQIDRKSNGMPERNKIQSGDN